MGLDYVEIVLAVEDSFQIHIEDAEAGEVVTVGDLFGLVAAKLQDRGSQRRLTSAAFYRVRRALVETLGVKRREINPATRLDAILPRRGRPEAWRRVQGATPLRVPDLEHPRAVKLSLIVIATAATVLPLRPYYPAPGAIALLAALGLVLGAVLIRLTPSSAVAFPNRNMSAGDLVKTLRDMNCKDLAHEPGAWNETEVWESLLRIVAFQTGHPLEKITPAARIMDALGID